MQRLNLLQPVELAGYGVLANESKREPSYRKPILMTAFGLSQYFSQEAAPHILTMMRVGDLYIQPFTGYFSDHIRMARR
jgi:hypothetical protein